MTATTATVEEVSGIGHNYKELIVETPATSDSTNTVAITLATYGATVIKSITGSVHSTANSIIIDEAPTTAVSNGVLTITLGGSSADNLVRVYRVIVY